MASRYRYAGRRAPARRGPLGGSSRQRIFDRRGRHPGRSGHRALSSRPAHGPRRRRPGSEAAARGAQGGGRVGTLLNHSERRMTLGDINRAIVAPQVGLATLVCADSPRKLPRSPSSVRHRPRRAPELIASSGRRRPRCGGSSSGSSSWSGRSIRAYVMCGAGVQTPDDVEKMIGLWSRGTDRRAGC